MHVVQTGVFFLSLSGSGGGNSSIYIEGLPAVLEGMCRLVCLRECTKQCHIWPYIIDFFTHLFRVGLTYNWYLLFCYFCFLEPHHLHKASNHPVISKLMHHFIYSILLLVNNLILDVEHLLSLLESWAPASSLTTFKPPWKTLFWHLFLQSIFLIELYYELIISTLFFSIMLLFSFPYLVARQIVQVIFILRFALSLISMLIFALIFI